MHLASQAIHLHRFIQLLVLQCVADECRITGTKVPPKCHQEIYDVFGGSHGETTESSSGHQVSS
jgi:hypothetical protein